MRLANHYTEGVSTPHDDIKNALGLIKCDPSNRALTQRGHDVINRNIAALLRDGLVVYDSRKHTGYRLTAAGKAVL